MEVASGRMEELIREIEAADKAETNCKGWLAYGKEMRSVKLV
jgi:hypothetical protein